MSAADQIFIQANTRRRDKNLKRKRGQSDLELCTICMKDNIIIDTKNSNDFTSILPCGCWPCLTCSRQWISAGQTHDCKTDQKETEKSETAPTIVDVCKRLFVRETEVKISSVLRQLRSARGFNKTYLGSTDICGELEILLRQGISMKHRQQCYQILLPAFIMIGLLNGTVGVGSIIEVVLIHLPPQTVASMVSFGSTIDAFCQMKAIECIHIVDTTPTPNRQPKTIKTPLSWDYETRHSCWRSVATQSSPRIRLEEACTELDSIENILEELKYLHNEFVSWSTLPVSLVNHSSFTPVIPITVRADILVKEKKKMMEVLVEMLWFHERGVLFRLDDRSEIHTDRHQPEIHADQAIVFGFMRITKGLNQHESDKKKTTKEQVASCLVSKSSTRPFNETGVHLLRCFRLMLIMTECDDHGKMKYAMLRGDILRSVIGE